MNKLTQALLYRGDRLERQNVLWNAAGSFVYAFASMVLSFLAIHLAGGEEGGIFSFGFSTLGQQLFIVAYFGIRPFQITDGKGEYTFGEYRLHRLLTSLLAVLAGALFLLWKYLGFLAGRGDYQISKCLILMLLVLYKTVDGYADVYESEFQRQGSLYLTGKSNFFRTLLSVAVFGITLAASRSLPLACAAALAGQAAGLALFDLEVLPALGGVQWSCSRRRLWPLTGSTMFLFVSTFLDFYIFSSAKYAIDARLNNAASGYFNLIFMPTSVIYMIANFVIRPFLTRLTALWDEKDRRGFTATLRRIAGIILGLLLLAVAAAAVLGKWVLRIMELLLGASYEGCLTPYFGAFLVVIAGGGFYALANLMYYGLVIMRRQRMIFCVYAAAAAAAAVISGPLVAAFGIQGAALCYLLLMLGLTAGFGICMTGVLLREKEERQEE